MSPLPRLAMWVRPDEYHQSFNFDYMETPFKPAELQKIVTDSIQEYGKVGASSTWVLSNHDVVRHATRYGGGPVGDPLGRGLGLGGHRGLAALDGRDAQRMGGHFGLQEFPGAGHALDVVGVGVQRRVLHAGTVIMADAADGIFANISSNGYGLSVTTGEESAIEGNTNGQGARDSVTGDGVWEKTRAKNLVRKFIRWNFLSVPATGTWST